MALPQEFDTSQPPIIQLPDGTWVVNEKANNIQRLMYNQRYHLHFNLGGQDFDIEFTSHYDPLYTTVDIIRADLRDIVDDMTDDEINFRIYQTGQLAQQLAGQAQRFILFGSAIGNIILQFQGVSRQDMRNAIPFPTPFYVQQYTRYKTELDIVYAKIVSLSMKAGTMEKDLGEFKVIREVMIPRLQDVLAELKSNLEQWEQQIRGGAEGKAKWTMRARYKQYPGDRGGSLGLPGQSSSRLIGGPPG
jgi:hypothetical protein